MRPFLEELLELGRDAEQGGAVTELFGRLSLLCGRDDYTGTAFASICERFGLDRGECVALALCLYRAEHRSEFPLPAQLMPLMADSLDEGRPLSILFDTDAGLLLSAACDLIFGHMPKLPEYLRLDPCPERELFCGEPLLGELDACLESLELGRLAPSLVIAVHGGAGTGKKALFAQLAASRGHSLLIADCSRLEQRNLPELAGLAVLFGAMLCLNSYRDSHAALATGILGFTELLLLSAREEPGGLEGCEAMLVRAMPAMSSNERLAALRSCLGGVVDDEVLACGARQCRCTVGAVMSAAARLRAEHAIGGRAITERELLHALGRSGVTALRENAQELVVSKSMSDLTLPPEQKRQIENLCAFARQRDMVWKDWGFEEKIPGGQGLTALFYGAPGTGKTFAACVIAAELGAALYRVDLSRLISKYIGETQKNIGKIFDDAQGAECILFFDEADALFSRRSEVSDSNDRHANAEIAYLLQRTEQHNGVILMATNLLQNFDEAFRRRIGFMIHFPMPDAAQREELWRGVFPAAAPLDAIDFPLLAETLELSGASIRSCALTAARLAAAEGGSINMTRISAAARDEYQKLGKSFPAQLAKSTAI